MNIKQGILHNSNDLLYKIRVNHFTNFELKIINNIYFTVNKYYINTVIIYLLKLQNSNFNPLIPLFLLSCNMPDSITAGLPPLADNYPDRRFPPGKYTSGYTDIRFIL